MSVPLLKAAQRGVKRQSLFLEKHGQAKQRPVSQALFYATEESLDARQGLRRLGVSHRHVGLRPVIIAGEKLTQPLPGNSTHHTET